MTEPFLSANWPVPEHIQAFTTLRTGGFSSPPYQSFNLGDHVGDKTDCVVNNRNLLQQKLNLPNLPMWLKQTHSTIVITDRDWQPHTEADAIVCDKPNQVCAILTADCLPILMSDKTGSQVAAIHAGWRGLQAGIIEKTLNRFKTNKSDLTVWFGPAIGPQVFEVGPEVKAAFLSVDEAAASAFTPTHSDRFLANLYLLARQRLHAQGVTSIYGGDLCTYSDNDRFFSFRRDGITGRMASLIWISAE